MCDVTATSPITHHTLPITHHPFLIWYICTNAQQTSHSTSPISHFPSHTARAHCFARQGPTASPRGERGLACQRAARQASLARQRRGGSPITGFTLIELLVAIAIVGILSTIGIVVYQGAVRAANSAKVKGDLDAIRKAYESNYNAETNTYQPLTAQDFAQGVIPSPPGGGSYFVRGPNSPYIPLQTPLPYYTLAADSASGVGGACSGTNCQTTSSTQGTQSCDSTGSLLNGLVGWWKFDEPSVSTATDSSGSNKNGIIGSAGASKSADVPSSNFGKSVQLDGVQGYIVVQNYTMPATGTISFWAKSNVSNWNDHGFLVSMRTPPNLIIHPNANTTDITLYTEGFAAIGYVSPPSPISQWNHYAWVLNGTQSIFYINNQATTINTANKWGTGAGDLYFGRDSTLARFLNGLIDDVRIYNRPLSASDISLLYNSSSGCI